MLVSPPIRIATEDCHPELNPWQLHAVDEILLSREKIVALDGVAGAGKTTTLAVIREGAELDGYRVEGFAPNPAQRRSSAKLASRPRLYRNIWHAGSPTQVRNDST